MSIGLSSKELEDLLFATSREDTRLRLLCALDLIDRERAEELRRELQRNGLLSMDGDQG